MLLSMALGDLVLTPPLEGARTKASSNRAQETQTILCTGMNA